MCAKLTSNFFNRSTGKAYPISDYRFIYLIIFLALFYVAFIKKGQYSDPFILFASHELCGKVRPVSTMLERNAAMNRLLKKLAPRATLKLYVAQKISRSNYYRGR